MNMTLIKVKGIIIKLFYILGYAQVVSDNDELFNTLIDQLILPEVHEGIKSEIYDIMTCLFPN